MNPPYYYCYGYYYYYYYYYTGIAHFGSRKRKGRKKEGMKGGRKKIRCLSERQECGRERGLDCDWKGGWKRSSELCRM